MEDFFRGIQLFIETNPYLGQTAAIFISLILIVLSAMGLLMSDSKWRFLPIISVNFVSIILYYLFLYNQQTTQETRQSDLIYQWIFKIDHIIINFIILFYLATNVDKTFFLKKETGQILILLLYVVAIINLIFSVLFEINKDNIIYQYGQGITSGLLILMCIIAMFISDSLSISKSDKYFGKLGKYIRMSRLPTYSTKDVRLSEHRKDQEELLPGTPSTDEILEYMGKGYKDVGKEYPIEEPPVEDISRKDDKAHRAQEAKEQLQIAIFRERQGRTRRLNPITASMAGMMFGNEPKAPKAPPMVRALL